MLCVRVSGFVFLSNPEEGFSVAQQIGHCLEGWIDDVRYQDSRKKNSSGTDVISNAVCALG